MIQSEKVQQVYSFIRERIDSGEFAVGDRLPTDEDFCEQFQLSRPTVAKAMRELERLGMVERKRRAGTFVRRRAQSAMLFGLLVPRLGTTEIFEPICAGIAKGLQQAGHSVLWASGADAKGAGADTGSDRSVIEAGLQLLSKRVSGVFFAPLELSDARDDINSRIAEMMDKAGVPVVLLDRDYLAYPSRSGYDLVGIDNRRAGYLVAHHLLEQGAQRVAFLAHRDSADTIEARIGGYRDALFEAGPVKEDLVLRCSPDDGAKIKAFIKSRKPDAIMCGNDATAAQLMQSLAKLGVSVPGDVLVAGFDDVGYAKLLSPPLTTIHQPCEAIGRAAVRLMLSRVQEPKLPARHVLIKTELIPRQSTGI
ncbi:MAG: GntR family transcriptional regulator [Phycisphaerales bacterium JB063]